MYKKEQATINDVDLILDMKLDIIFNSAEAENFEKSDYEKIVNYCEEEIRNNLSDFYLIYDNDGFTNNLIGIYGLSDYEDGKILDVIYIKAQYRQMGYATLILKDILKSNYQKVYLWVYKSNEVARNFYKKMNFKEIEETETRFFLVNNNEKEENKEIKAKMFCDDVAALSKKYNLEYFFTTNGMISSWIVDDKNLSKYE